MKRIFISEMALRRVFNGYRTCDDESAPRVWHEARLGTVERKDDAITPLTDPTTHVMLSRLKDGEWLVADEAREVTLANALRDALALAARVLDDCEHVEPQYQIEGIEKYTAKIAELQRVLDET